HRIAVFARHRQAQAGERQAIGARLDEQPGVAGGAAPGVDTAKVDGAAQMLRFAETKVVGGLFHYHFATVACRFAPAAYKQSFVDAARARNGKQLTYFIPTAPPCADAAGGGARTP